jgi:hypothetical protein
MTEIQQMVVAHLTTILKYCAPTGMCILQTYNTVCCKKKSLREPCEVFISCQATLVVNVHMVHVLLKIQLCLHNLYELHEGSQMAL